MKTVVVNGQIIDIMETHNEFKDKIMKDGCADIENGGIHRAMYLMKSMEKGYEWMYYGDDKYIHIMEREKGVEIDDENF